MNGKKNNSTKEFSKKENSNSKKKYQTSKRNSYSRCDKGSSESADGRKDYIRDNDPTWYTSYPGIYSSTANISFNKPVGVPTNLGTSNDQPFDVQDSNFNVPNVMSIGVTLTPGISTNAASMINTSMFQNYNFVRHANSGSKNYDAVDLEMYFLAVDNALSFLWEGIRAYGCLSTFSALNRSIPKALFTAMGFDYESWSANPAQVRARLNVASTKMASLCIPKNNRLTDRHQSLFQNIFMDGETVKGQMYVFTMSRIHKWGRVSQVGKLTAQNVLNYSTPLTVDAYFELLDSQLKPLLEDEDINIMSGDVLKAYGANGLCTIPVVPDLYITPISTSSENPYMMSQIENMRWVALDNYDISQSVDGHILFEPSYVIPTAELLTNGAVVLPSVADLLNARSTEVSNEDVIEMTRLHPTLGAEFVDGGVQVRIRSCGTELPDSVRIITGDVITGVDLVNSALNKVPTPYFNFDWAPLLYIAAVLKVGETYTAKVSNVIGDLANYTVVNKMIIDLLHETAVASQFLIDAPGKSI